ncbi:MAG: cytochrome D1 domain-containing protein [Allosphingosinicella sp.]|uniref:YncE family protein n=1 Tax=Allosphingosinicella sp. TaxID=2823234 RepID=UPI00395FEB6C
MQSFASKYLRNKTPALPAHHGLFEQLGLLALAAAALMLSGVAAAQGQSSPWQQGAFVYTADEHGSSISAIDLAGGHVSTVPISISPHNVQITADGKRLLAVGEPAADGHGHAHGGNAHGANDARGRLLILDTTGLGAKPATEIVVGDHPAHVIPDPRSERAFVTNAGDNTVSVVDLAAGTLIATIGTGRYPHGLRMSPNGREVYVANVQDGTVSVIDADGFTELARIPVGTTPVQVGFTPDGTKVYVSLRDENRVAVIDTASRSLVGTIEVGRNPIQVYATPDGRFVYVANQGTDAEPADTVSVIDVSSGMLVDTIRTGMGAHGVVVSSDGAWAFVTNIVEGTVSAIDAATGEVVTNFSVGRGPNGITYRPPQE